MKRFDLENRFDHCPVYWQNFIRHLQTEYNYMGRDVSVRIIQRELKKFGGRYHLEGSESYDFIEFESEQLLTLFALKWS